MAVCSKGHYYDESRDHACPVCGVGVGQAPAGGQSPATQYEEPEGPPLGQRPPAFRGGGFGPGPGKPAFRPQPAFVPQGGPAGKTVYAEEDEAVERLMGFLVVADSREDEPWRYFRLRKGVNTVGRFGSRAQVEIRDSQVSMEHALIVCTDSASRVIDLDSGNGVFVNTDRTEIASLSTGDEVQLGRTRMVYTAFPYVADD